jgi:hypothetical protein
MFFRIKQSVHEVTCRCRQQAGRSRREAVRIPEQAPSPDLSVVFRETTSLSFCGEGGETVGEYGFSKDYSARAPL